MTDWTGCHPKTWFCFNIVLLTNSRLSRKEANTYLSTNVLMTARVSSTKRSMVDLVTMKWWLQDDRPVPKWLGRAKRTSSCGPKLSIVSGTPLESGACLLAWPSSSSQRTPSSSATDEVLFLSLHKHRPIISIYDATSFEEKIRMKSCHARRQQHELIAKNSD